MNSVADFKALAARLDQVLPQTQCTQCGFDGCMPYAKAMAEGEAPINRCPPGGPQTIAELAAILHVERLPLDPSCGTHKALEVAVIDESLCIGCTLCITACPVDAVLGAPKQMHAIIAQRCSGCELCIAPCPVDCISMQPSELAWTKERQDQARTHHQSIAGRLQRVAELAKFKRDARLDEHGRNLSQEDDGADLARRRLVVAQALERARARRSGSS